MQRAGLQYDAVLLAANNNHSDLWDFFVPSTDGTTLATPEHRVRFSWLQRCAVLLAANDHPSYLWDFRMPIADDVTLATHERRVWFCRLQRSAVLRATSNHSCSSHVHILHMPSSVAPAAAPTQPPLW